MLDALPAAVNGRPQLVRRGRFLTVDFRWTVGALVHDIQIHQGRVTDLRSDGGLLRPWRFHIAAAEEVWQRFWEPLPAPGYHDIFALTKSGHARLEGDLLPFMANLRYFKEIMALPREFNAFSQQETGR